MDKKQEQKISKTLSYLLRHNPKQFNVKLDREGFALISSVIKGLKLQYKEFNKDDLIFIVENDSKGRYEIKGDYIRALYGHSIKKEIEKIPSKPPSILYLGYKQYLLRNYI